MTVTIAQLLKGMVEHQASDLHLTCGSPPTFRVHGQILKAKAATLHPNDTKELCYSMLNETQRMRFEDAKQLDFSFGVKELGRFRANIFYQRGTVACALRYIPFDIPELSLLGLPAQVETLMRKPRGLVLVTGATGCGKTTTLASMIDTLNHSAHLHILTIEDPIEYVHSHGHSLVNQREIGQDASSFPEALRSALREDPDVVLVGEMRDKETIETALTLAETGHLVISTLHTNSAYQSISRIVQGFPRDHQDQIRMQLSLVLEGIITQALLEKKDGTGRALAIELLIPNASIRNLIRENKLFQIPSAMLVGQETTQMITLNQSLIALVRRGIISADEALSNSPEPEELIKNFSDLMRKAGEGNALGADNWV